MTASLSILLVDDDEDEYTIVKDLLRDVGADASVAWVSSYEMGLTRICERTWDVCLVDYHLGLASGLDFVEATVSLGCHSPIILLTGQGDRATDEAAMRRGAADYLLKDGLTGEVLERSVRHAIERTRTLKTSQNFLQATLDALTAHICIVGGDGQILAVNQAWSRFALDNGGDPHRCALGSNYLTVCDTAVDCLDAKKVAAEIRAMLQGDKNEASLAYTCDGPTEPRWFLLRMSRFSDGEPRCVVISHEDISSHKNAEIALQRSEERFRLAFESVPVGMVLLTREQRFLEANLAFCAMLGYSESHLLQKPLSELLYPEDRPHGRIPTGGHSLRLLRSDGALCWVNYTSVQVRLEDGHDSYELGMVVNKTQDLQRDGQIQQLQKMEEVARLAGGVAHDFNNISTAIQGYAVLILDQLPVHSALRGDVEEIHKASLRATALTRQLLAFSRKQILQPKVLYLNQLVEDMLSMLRRLIGEDVSIRTQLADSLGWVRVDQGQFEQVIMNLVVNARDAMPQGGTVSLASSNLLVDAAFTIEHPQVIHGPYVCIQVGDTGLGMSAEVRNQVFDPFFTTRVHGTGLGLSIVDGIMKQSGGAVLVDSQVGHGTVFQLLFPAVPAPELGEQPAVVASEPCPSGLCKIMVVEDDDMVRGLTCRILRLSGYTVVEARSGREALKICSAHALKTDREPISLVLTDVVMPDLSGLQLADQLRTVYPSARILYTSGYNDEAILIRGIAAQQVAFLPKPFSPDTLIRAVQGALALPVHGPIM